MPKWVVVMALVARGQGARVVPEAVPAVLPRGGRTRRFPARLGVLVEEADVRLLVVRVARVPVDAAGGTRVRLAVGLEVREAVPALDRRVDVREFEVSHHSSNQVWASPASSTRAAIEW